MSDHGLIPPVLVLVGWTFVMWFWMYATRIPAMREAAVDLEELSRTGAPLELPPEISRVADNYNHLHEQRRSTRNVIMVRFAVFAVGCFVLMALFARTVLAL